MKKYLMFGVILLSLLLTSCFKKESYSFQEGEYRYDGEEFFLYQEICVENIYIYFQLLENDSIDFSNSTNLIENRKDKIVYNVSFYLKIKDTSNRVKCNLESLPKKGDQVDRYYINLDLSELTNEETFFKMILTFDADSDYETIANTIYLSMVKLSINGIEYDKSSELFPIFFKDYGKIELKYIKEPTINKSRDN